MKESTLKIMKQEFPKNNRIYALIYIECEDIPIKIIQVEAKV